MSRNRVFVEIHDDGEFLAVVRIFRHWRAAAESAAYDLGKVIEYPRSVAVENIRRQVFRRAANECERCGAPITWATMHMHEKVFKSDGGEVSLENCQALCYDCHLGRPSSAHSNRSLRFTVPVSRTNAVAGEELLVGSNHLQRGLRAA